MLKFTLVNIMENKNVKIAMLQMMICSILWSVGGIFIKLISWNPYAIAGARSFFSAITVLVFMKVTKQKIRFSKKIFLSMIFLSGLFFCFVIANKLTTSANAIVLQYSSPIFILIFSYFIFREKISKEDLISVFLVMAGIVIFFIDSMGKGRTLGNLIGVFAGIFMAALFICVGKTQSEEKMSGILMGHLLTALIGLPFIFKGDCVINTQSMIFVVILGVVQLGIPYILMALASKSCPPLPSCLISTIEPILNPVWVAIFYGEIPGLMAIVGGGIIIFGVTFQCISKLNKE